jgi:hypothetical protein
MDAANLATRWVFGPSGAPERGKGAMNTRAYLILSGVLLAALGCREVTRCTY